jgi:hypothetical protein
MQLRRALDLSMHCFTRGIQRGETVDPNLLYRDSREERVFDLDRYALSLDLPKIVEGLGTRKCFHSGKGNFFTVQVVQGNGGRGDYEVYFTVSCSGGISLYVQSAYIRDAGHKGSRGSRPRSKPIGFYIILFNTLNGKAIRAPA